MVPYVLKMSYCSITNLTNTNEFEVPSIIILKAYCLLFKYRLLECNMCLSSKMVTVITNLTNITDFLPT